MFNVGEKVVCINDDWKTWVYDTYDNLPVKGNVYTIRECDIGRDNLGSVGSGQSGVSYLILLEELSNMHEVTPSGVDLGEIGFRSDRFAPLQTASDEEKGKIVKVETGTKVLSGKN